MEKAFFVKGYSWCDNINVPWLEGERSTVMYMFVKTHQALYFITLYFVKGKVFYFLKTSGERKKSTFKLIALRNLKDHFILMPSFLKHTQNSCKSPTGKPPNSNLMEVWP